MGDDAGGICREETCLFGRRITWLLSTVIEYGYHIACLRLVFWIGIHESMKLHFALSTYLRFETFVQLSKFVGRARRVCSDV